MPRLPGPESLGTPGTYKSNRTYASGRDMFSTAQGEALQKIGNKLVDASVSAIKEKRAEENELDLVRADAHWKMSSLTSAEAIEADPEYGNRTQKWGLESGAILDDAAGMIRDPKLREKFKIRAEVDRNSINERLKGGVRTAEKKAKITDLETSIESRRNVFIDNKRDLPTRLQAKKDIDAYIEVAKMGGLIDEADVKALRDKWVKGSAFDAANTMLDTDPEELGKMIDLLPAWEESQVKGDDLGQVSAKYESGGKGVGFISSGKDDPGGMSYGVHQLSGAYSVGAFLRSPEGSAYRNKFAGLRPQSAEFNRVYKEIAQSDPEGFAKAQKEFYTRTHYEPVKAKAASLGLNVKDRGVQEALFSMGVQHGKAQQVVAEAARRLGKDKGDPKKQIEALYEARYDYVKGLRNLPPNTKQAVLNRYRREFKDALKFAGQGGDPEGVQVASVDTGTMTDATEGAPVEGEKQPVDPPEVAEKRQLAIQMFGALDPEQRAKFLKASKVKSSERKESLLYDIKRGMDGYVQSLEQNGEPAPGLDLELAKQTVDPRVWNSFENRVAEANATYNARFSDDGRPIERMTDQELENHLTNLVPGPDTDAKEYELLTNVYTKTKAQADKIRKLRAEDPARAVEGYPEVKRIADAIAAGDETVTQGQLVEARLEAQDRLGIDPADQKPLTKVEAKALLDLPANKSELSPKQYKLRLQAAADRAEEQYGPVLARRVFKAAVAQHVKDQTGSEASVGIITKMARGEDVTRDDIRRMTELTNIDKIGSIWGRQLQPDLNQTERPTISPITAMSESAGMSDFVKSKKLERQPSAEIEAWIQANPDQWAIVDAEFGRGTAARLIAKAKAKTPKP